MTIKTLSSSPARLFQNLPREALIGGIVVIASAAALAGVTHSANQVDNGAKLDALVRPTALPPAPEPLLVRDLPPETALKVNAEIPLASGPNPASRPFVAGAIGAETRSRALDCLAQAIYYEAANESDDGQRAVAQVVLNRVRHPAFPSSICSVVFEGSRRVTGCQFTFTCDGSLTRHPSIAGMARARRIADAALNGSVYAPVGSATHYHANFVVPYWASSVAKSAVVGAHIFYRWTGGWGRPAAFVQRYSGSEPNPDALRMAALSTDRTKIIEGPLAKLMTIDPSSNGKRVMVRFSPEARAAVEAAPHLDYVERVAASDNLRWTLAGGGEAAAKEAPLGRSAPAAPEALAVTQPAR
jgi:spore germination cell wall hydrolase CwlJ-like protein